MSQKEPKEPIEDTLAARTTAARDAARDLAAAIRTYREIVSELKTTRDDTIARIDAVVDDAINRITGACLDQKAQWEEFCEIMTGGIQVEALRIVEKTLDRTTNMATALISRNARDFGPMNNTPDPL